VVVVGLGLLLFQLLALLLLLLSLLLGVEGVLLVEVVAVAASGDKAWL